MSAIRVLLVDDHTVLREGLKLMIGSQPDMIVVGEAERGQDVAAFLRSHEVDVVVMDISMPQGGGIQATEQLRAEFPCIKVVALTRHAEKAYLKRMLDAGVTGYVLKQTAPALLLDGIRSVAGGGTYIDPAVAGKLAEPFGSGVSAVPPGSLSPREQVIAQMVARGHTNKEIAALLEITVKTVETHKNNIMQKLGVGSRAELVRYAQAQGWLKP